MVQISCFAVCFKVIRNVNLSIMMEKSKMSDGSVVSMQPNANNDGKRKRVRPNWGDVRSLEAEIGRLKSELAQGMDALHDRCVECDAWRDKYRALMDEFKALKKGAMALKEELHCKNADISSLRRVADERLKELLSLRERTFWQRVKAVFTD